MAAARSTHLPAARRRHRRPRSERRAGTRTLRPHPRRVRRLRGDRARSRRAPHAPDVGDERDPRHRDDRRDARRRLGGHDAPAHPRRRHRRAGRGERLRRLRRDGPDARDVQGEGREGTAGAEGRARARSMMDGEMRFTVMSLSYVVASLLFIFGLRQLSHPRSARSGNRLAAAGMTIALLATLLDRGIVSYLEIAIGTAIGAAIGIYSARRVQMTAMPQMVALFNGMGGATAALVSIAELLRASGHGERLGFGAALSGALGIAIGAISLTGSLVAFGKLQEILPGRPLLFPGRHLVNALLALAVLVLGGWIALGTVTGTTVWGLFGVALLLGVLVVMPIGGGDMPVMISVLNSIAGVAAALTGIVLSNQVLVVAGVLVGASGTLLTLLMSRAMNRSLTNVMFGGFGAETAAAGGGTAVARPVRQTSAEDAAIAMAFANRVIVIPGYGLAVAEGQRQVKELSSELEKRGVDVKYAIHPVAGRMPGHMNVLLAEADIPYEQ